MRAHIHIGGMNPGRDWRVLLGIFCALLVGIVGWHIFAFGAIVSSGSLRDTRSGQATTSTTSLLETLPALLDERATEDARYVNGVYRFADPSQ